jgi:glycogen(starch) synthase
MRILAVSNLYPPRILGGYELGCRNVVAGLVGRGHEVTVVTSPSHVRPGEAADADVGGARLERTLSLRSFGVEASANALLNRAQHFEEMVSSYANTAILLDAISTHRPDCVYLFNLIGIGGLGLLDALNSIAVPWVFHLMDSVPATLQKGSPLDTLAVFNAHQGGIYAGGRLISMSASLVDEIESLLKFRFPTRPVIVPGWVNVTTPVRERPYFRSGHVRFVTAGAVALHKGIAIIIQAVAMLKAERIQNFSVDVFGSGEIGHFVDLAKQFNVAELISFHGPRRQEELLATYDTADAFLFPTWPREPFGFAPVEAASAGCIPVVTRKAGVCEQLTDGLDCLMIERNPVALAAAMRRFCAGQIDASAMGGNAQSITRTRLNFETCLSQIEDVLTSSLQCRGPYEPPGWRELNLAYLKHHLALRMYLQAAAAKISTAGTRAAPDGAELQGANT